MSTRRYHILLENGSLGPFDRRTIVGLRVKNALSDTQTLLDSNGRKLSVQELVARDARRARARPASVTASLIQASYPATLVGLQGRGFPVPRFQGEIEVRVQPEGLRIAGAFRRWNGWRQGRIKIPLEHIAHARTQGGQVALWLRPPGTGEGTPRERLQGVTLALGSAKEAQELLHWLPAEPPPFGLQPAAPLPAAGRRLVWAVPMGVVTAAFLAALTLRLF
ncbi:MAG: hypothetical protein Q8N17_22160 [Burkholderiaceae bacterium]|nr:hypothetical protein [Burkholderiaceae bacterium]